MALSPGTRLGHYDVTSLIGEGGMGQVWQATDTQLNRQVALKILPDAFAADPDRLARFTREAQILASLNHPNIAAIHGIEEDEVEGRRALVLELVEGPTVADRIAQGAMPIEDALPIAKQIAEALEAAHEAGVIHRDLKPANIKVREDGTVKVLDFGLAKALDPAPDADPSQSPTLTAAATQMGVIMGTAAYMSPEQARGKPVDRRADIWAFGCVLYEMLTGVRAFQGEDVSVTLADVIKSDVLWDALPRDLPVALSTYLRGCLQKEPRQRVRDIGDVRLAMEGVFDVATVSPAASSWGRRVSAAWLIGALAVSGLLTAAAFTYLWVPEPAPEPRRVHVSSGVVVRNLSATDFAMSPDGSTLVYAGIDVDGSRRLYQRPLDQFVAAAVPGTEGARGPFFSADGHSVAFVDDDDALKRVSLAGGVPTIIAQVPTSLFRGGSWGADGTIVYGVADSGLWRVLDRGGEAEPVTAFSDGETLHADPDLHIVPRVLFFTVRVENTVRIAAIHLDTGERWDFGVGSRPRLTSNGRLVYERDGALWVASFDVSRMEVRDDPVLVADEISTFAVSQNGSTLSLVPPPLSHLVWVDRSGQTTPLAFESSRTFLAPRLSPAGRKLAVYFEGGIWVLDLERGGRLLLSGEINAYYPLWTPDGLAVTFSVTAPPESGGGVYQRVADGSGSTEVLSDEALVAASWFPDGTRFSYWDYPPVTTLTQLEVASFGIGDRDIGVMTRDGEISQLTDTPFNERTPRFSPDGRWLAFMSDESGRDEVYIQSYPDAALKTAISTNGGVEPAWSRDGRELFYWTLDGGTMMSVRVDYEPSLAVTVPVPLFSGRFERFGAIVGHPNYDVSPDGERFIMMESAPTTFNLILNWSRDVDRLLSDN